MDFRVNREIVTAAECVYEGMQEQGIELDYILPDYYPDIFKLVRCEVTPVVTERAVSGDKLTYELRCDIKILYCSETGAVLQCVNQRKSFTKTVELGRSCENPTVKLVPKTDHINYRAVNKRRLDLRGAVSVKIRVECDKVQEVISDAFGLNVQLKKTPVSYASSKLTAEKVIQLTEETELSETQPAIINVINTVCTLSECDRKMISGKMLAKGEADISLLYSCEKDGSGALEEFSFTVPYSQIIDMDGLDENFVCNVKAELVSCELTPTADKNGENRIIRCELELRLVCRAVKTVSVMLGTDAYSTVHPCEVASAEIRTEQLPLIYNENFRHTAVISEADSGLQTIYGMWCTAKNINVRCSEEDKKLVISGMMCYTTAAKDSSGMIVMPEKDEAFEETVDFSPEHCGSDISVNVSVAGVSYNITPEGVLTAKADVSAEISVSGSLNVKALSDISIDDSVKKQRDGDYAIKLYYGVENEEVWDIAKRYSTSVEAVMEENELSGERLESGGMLLIPIVN